MKPEEKQTENKVLYSNTMDYLSLGIKDMAPKPKEAGSSLNVAKSKHAESQCPTCDPLMIQLGQRLKFAQ